MIDIKPMFLWICILLIILIIYNLFFNNILKELKEHFETDTDIEDHAPYDLTQDSYDLDARFDQFQDTRQYLKKPKSSKCFTDTNSQYSRRKLNPKNHVMPQVYFPPSNKTQSRIINVDEFKTNILDNIRARNSANNIENKDNFEEAPDPIFSYYEHPNYSVVDTDIFDKIIEILKTELDNELNNYVQTGSTQIKCLSDMSDCPTYTWEPAIIQIRLNDEYYEYTFQFTYYIQKKAYAYVIVSKCYISRSTVDIGVKNDNNGNSEIGDIKLYIEELDLMGLNHEQNIMLTPGYTESQMENQVNIFSDYPYTPYEADLTYYRSSDENTYLRDITANPDFMNDVDKPLIDEMVEAHQNLQTSVTGGSVCISQETGELLNYNTKEECEATIDDEGNPKESGTFDSQCSADADCPFYLGNMNYPNTRGGCGEDGFCELPVNTELLSYTSYNDEGEYYPYCYGCNIDKMETCCEVQQKMVDGTATEEEIDEHGLTGKTFVTPDYAFKDDFTDRMNYIDDLEVNGLNVN
jgi:hypothetical protein